MKKLTATLALLPALAACTIDAYEKGEGEYSLTVADFVEAYVDADKQVTAVVTDDDTRLTVQPVLTAKWIETADTVYRAMLYYNTVAPGVAEPVSFGRVGVLVPRDSLRDTLLTDPLHLESAWLSHNRHYLNLRLRLLTGATDDDSAVHTLGLLRDTTLSTATHMHTVLYHDQGGQPEYYSVTTFASIPLAAVQADTLSVTVHTYSGPLTRTFSLVR